MNEQFTLKLHNCSLLPAVTTTSVNIVRSPSAQTVSTSDQLSLTCITNINPSVDTPIQVTHDWKGPSGVITTGSGRTISAVVGSNLQYNSTLIFNSLRSSDSGTYICTSTVNPDSLSVFVTSSAITTSSTSFNAGNLAIYSL